MSSLFRLAVAGCAILFGPVALLAAPAKRAEAPLDLIVVVDVSLSMSKNYNTLTKDKDGKITWSATDPEGIRWDGIQFLIDTANDEDRVALVIFRTDAALVTAGLPNQKNGYVMMKDGRKALKEAVRRLQEHELSLEKTAELQLAPTVEQSRAEEDAPLLLTKPKENRLEDFLPMPAATGETRWAYLGSGTSNVLTLRALAEWELLAKIAERPQYVLLFTDGEDACYYQNFNMRTPGATNPLWKGDKPFRLIDKPNESKIIQWGGAALESMIPPDFLKLSPADRKNFDESKYKALREKDVLSRIQRNEPIIDITLATLRKANVNVFTFGLGPDVEKTMLERIVSGARPTSGVKDFRGATFFAKDNLKLFEQLQHVGWELRERWKVTGVPSRTSKTEAGFNTPSLDVCQSLGALTYSKLPNQAQAQAPLKSLLRPGDPPITARTYSSRSHDYLQVLPQAGTGPREISVEHPEGREAICEFGLRPITPSVELAQPDPTVGYSLLDAIPVRVDFEDIETAKLEPAMFRVTARIFRNGPDGTPQATYELALETRMHAPGSPKWSFEKKWHVARAAFESNILAAAMCGEWNLDVEIETVCTDEKFPDHPLGKAKRKLLRRQFRIDGYPKLKLPEVSTIRTDGPVPGRGKIVLSLDTKFAADELILPDGERVRTETSWLDSSMKYPDFSAANFKGIGGVATAELSVDLTKLDWSTVAKSGRRAAVKTKSNVPDSLSKEAKAQSAEFGIDLRKGEYELQMSSEKLAFDLSNTSAKDPKGRSSKDEVRPSLKTDLFDRAQIRLVVPPDGLIPFRRLGAPEAEAPLKLLCASNEPTAFGAARLGNTQPEVPLALTLRPLDDKPLAPGRYEANVAVRSTADSSSSISSKSLKLTVSVDQLNVAFVGYRKDRLESAALAGTNVELPIKLEMALVAEGTQTLSVRARPKQNPMGPNVALPAVTLVGIREPAWQAVLGSTFGSSPEMEYRLKLAIPESADNGDYQFELDFQLEAISGPGKTKTFSANASVSMQVQRYGLSVSPVTPDGAPVPDRILFESTPGDTQAKEQKIRLAKTVLGTMRWSASVVASPGTPALKTAEKPWFDGLELLASDAGNPNVLHRPSDPIGTKRATTPLGIKQPEQELRLKLSSPPLAPGRYTAVIRFIPRLEGADATALDAVLPDGAAIELPVELIVAGVVPALSVDTDGKQLRAEIRGVKADIGEWEIRSDDHPGWIGALALSKSPRDEITSIATGTVPVPLSRGGPNRFKLIAVGQPTAVPPTAEVIVPARVTLHRQSELPPAPGDANKPAPLRLLFASGDTVIARVRLATGAAAPPALILRRRDDPNASFPPIPLSDDGKNGDAQAGDGEYAGQFTFPTDAGAAYGEYTVSLDPSAKLPYGVEPAKCLLGVARAAEPRSDTLEHSKGLFEIIYGPAQVVAPELVRLKIQGLSNARYRLRVKYLVAGSDADKEGFLARKQVPTSDVFDPRIHLAVKTRGPSGEAGELLKEVWIPFGLEVDLTPEAQKAIEEGLPHPSIEQKSGVMLVITVTGTDSEGRIIEWEDEIPYQVKPKNFYFRTGLVWLIAGVIALPLGVFGIFRWRRWKDKGKVVVAQSAGAGNDILTEKQHRPPQQPAQESREKVTPPPAKPNRLNKDDLF